MIMNGSLPTLLRSLSVAIDDYGFIKVCSFIGYGCQ